jgi:hypothetical protein
MKAERISLMIDSICKEQGIDYCSTNPHYVTLKEDIIKMSKIYLQLKQTIGIIKEIEDRHQLNGLKEKFEEIINHLDSIDHDLIRLARQLKEKNVY